MKMNNKDKRLAALPIANELAHTMKLINSDKSTLKQFEDRIANLKYKIEADQNLTLVYRNLLKELGQQALLEEYETLWL